MLKQRVAEDTGGCNVQPPSGGCVLKPTRFLPASYLLPQPPSGGCVLKLMICVNYNRFISAAFGRLCVETAPKNKTALKIKPAAFGRLCVETIAVLIA